MNNSGYISYGIHAGTLMSRDAGTAKVNSLKEAKIRFKSMQKDFIKMGYRIWYAYYLNDNEKVQLCEGDCDYHN